MGRQFVVGQHDAAHEIRIVADVSGQHIDAAVGQSAGRVGDDGLVVSFDWGKHKAVAVAIVADAEEIAPVFAPHVAFHFDDAARAEVEAVFRDAAGGDVAIAGA